MIADTVANKFDGIVAPERNENGYVINIPNPNGGRKPLVIRLWIIQVQEVGKPYFRVIIDGIGEGIISSNRDQIHINLTDDFLNQIKNIISNYKR